MAKGGLPLLMAGLSAGVKFVPLLGGGFCPAYGPPANSSTPGGGIVILGPNRGARIVEALPDSKMATYTFRPSGLAAMALGRSPSIVISVISWRVTGSKTCTRFSMAQETYARKGDPAKMTSAGASRVESVATTRWACRSTMLTESEI